MHRLISFAVVNLMHLVKHCGSAIALFLLSVPMLIWPASDFGPIEFKFDLSSHNSLFTFLVDEIA